MARGHLNGLMTYIDQTAVVVIQLTSASSGPKDAKAR